MIHYVANCMISHPYQWRTPSILVVIISQCIVEDALLNGRRKYHLVFLEKLGNALFKVCNISSHSCMHMVTKIHDASVTVMYVHLLVYLYSYLPTKLCIHHHSCELKCIVMAFQETSTPLI